MFTFFGRKKRDPHLNAQREREEGYPVETPGRTERTQRAENDRDLLAAEIYGGPVPAAERADLLLRLNELVERGIPASAIVSVLQVLWQKQNRAGTIEIAAALTDDARRRVVERPLKIEFDPRFPPEPFYEHLAWIGETDLYRRLYEETQGQEPPELCCFCGGGTQGTATIDLLNRWRVHEKCYALLTANLRTIDSTLQARLLFDASPNVMSSFRFINTWWPNTLPPDWNVRTNSVLARALYRCEDCTCAGEPLTIRHIVATEKGGSHELENLIALCPLCERQYELDQSLGTIGPDNKRRRYRDQKIEIIEQARQVRRDVHFTYKDAKGTVSVRTITPSVWEDRQGAPFIVGFCYMLNENESFDVSRMSAVSSG